jgi:60 kDa SS-A/Ro ribonucleoprotein
MVTLNVEKDAMAVGFTAASGHGFNRVNGLTELGISPRQRLDDVVSTIARLPMGSTDCALPFTVAQQEGWELDVITTFTDNETWAGPIHVHQAQRAYREATGIPTRSVNVAMAANAWTVNDPNDLLGLDVAGLDASVPQVISDFSAGR